MTENVSICNDNIGKLTHEGIQKVRSSWRGEGGGSLKSERKRTGGAGQAYLCVYSVKKIV